ncbi:MAG: cellulose synthase subunit BcsC-related outer membrane protein [Steroidobacterales bacterium]
MRSLILLFGILGFASLAFADPALPIANETLLHSARVWEAHDRGDLARLALEKLVAARPDSAEFLEMQGELCLRMNDMECAHDVLDRLSRDHANERATHSFFTAYRLATTDRLAYAAVRRLVQLDRGTEARAVLEKLLPDGAPGGYASLEYYRLLAATPDGWEAARSGLRRLAAEHADDPRYQLALARVLIRNATTRPEGQRLLGQLRRRDDLAEADIASIGGVPAKAGRSLGAAQTHAAIAATAPAPAIVAPNPAAIAAAARWRDAEAEARMSGQPDLAQARANAASAFEAQDFEAVIAAAGHCEAAGGVAEAGEMLEVARQLDPASHWLFASRVRWLATHGEPAAALALLDAPGPVRVEAGDGALRGIALDARAIQELAQGNAQSARSDLQAAHEFAPADPWIALRLARRYAADGDTAAGRRLFAAQSSANPHDPDQRFAEALFLETVDDRAGARSALDAVPAGEQSDGMRALRARLDAADQPRPKTASTAAAPDSFVTAGISFTERPGDGGTSELHAWLLPSEWRFGLAGGNYFFVRADAVQLDSGTLPAASTIPLLGTIQEAGPAGAAAAALANTSATGVAPGIGYVGALFAADIGTTPLGFLATNVVGGVKFTPSVGPVDLSVGIARRPVTSSLLSYAGMRDPVSGRGWGGVVETGPRLQAGIYASDSSLQLSVRASRLDGTNVLANSFFGARFAGDQRFLHRSAFDLYAGVTATYWNYTYSMLNYTFGSGGYYSPQSYLSIGLPLALEGSRGRFSYRARVTLAYSTSDTRDMPFYPHDSALQAAAASEPLPSGYSQPIFAGGRSAGTSFSFYGAVEYELSRRLILGAVLDLDRSAYYHPTGFMLYLRHALGSSGVSLARPPRPVRPYADY